MAAALPAPPATMRAVVTRLFRSLVVREVPTPVPDADEILIKVSVAALNPTDFKAKVFARGGTLLGCEFAGSVVSAPEGSGFGPGDEVAGAVMGGWGPRHGAFAEYLVTDPALVWHRPPTLSPAQAASLNVGWATAALALDGMLAPFATAHSLPPSAPLVIYSANSCTGQHALQYARLFLPDTPVVALASADAHARLADLGAALCLPYALPADELARRIAAAGLGRPRLAFDAHSAGDSVAKLEGVLEAPGKIVTVLGAGSAGRGGIERGHVFAYTITGKPIRLLWMSWPASPEDRALGTKRLKELAELMKPGGPIRPVPTRSIGGLDEVAEGLRMLKAGDVRGEKLVVDIAQL